MDYTFEAGTCICKDCRPKLDKTIVGAMQNLREWIRGITPGKEIALCLGNSQKKEFLPGMSEGL